MQIRDTKMPGKEINEAVLELKNGYIGYPMTEVGKPEIGLLFYPKPRWMAISVPTGKPDDLKVL